ncbi:hypothetical protein EHM76_00395 [bacterium]|nr:MAG: hypothetical protein EHM76_00395 [bacterium]
MGQVGIIPLIPIAIKAIPAIIGIFGGKKKKKAAERMAQYEANAMKIASGQAIAATDAMTEADKTFLRKVWPQINAAASFDHPNWSALGYPAGPPVSPAGYAAIKHAWPTVHVASNFDDVNWQYHAVPIETVANLLPIPELPEYMQPAQPYLPNMPDWPGNFMTDSQGRTLVDSRTGKPVQASMFPSGIPKEVLIAGGIGLLLLLSSRR